MEAITAPGQYAPAALAAATLQSLLTLGIATAAYITGPAEDPPNLLYTPRLYGDIEVSQSGVDAFGIGGRVALGVADIELWDADLSFLGPVAFGTADGRGATIRVVDVVDPRASDFGTSIGSARIAFRGILQRADHSGGSRARLTITDASERLAVKLQPALFAGTGGLEGPATLKDRPKPICLGVTTNISPVSVGNVDLGLGSLPTYLVNSRAVQDITAIRIRAVAQSIVGIAPTVGEAVVWEDQGAFQLGSSPDGAVTCDVEGDNVGGYVDTTAEIIQRLLQDFGPALADTDIHAESFRRAIDELPGAVGFYQGADEIVTTAAIDRLIAGPGAILCGGRDGAVRLVDPLAQGPAQFQLGLGRILALEPVPMPAALRPLPWVVAADWAPNGTQMTDFAGTVSDADRARFAAAARGPVRSESTYIATHVAQRREMRLPSLYAAEADALVRAAQWRAFFEAGPRMFRVTTDRYLGQVEVGDLGALACPQYDLDRGVGVVVLGYQEALAGRRLTLTVVTVPWVTDPPAAEAGVFFVLDEDLLA